MYVLHDYQTVAVEWAEEALDSGRSILLDAPTGSGKSFIQADLMRRRREKGFTHLQTAPSLEICLGIASKLPGVADLRSASREGQRRVCESLGVWTPRRLYNAVLRGEVPIPDSICHDEAHHTVASTFAALDAYLPCPAVGLTATAFRGTPDETAKLRARWGIPRKIISLKAAVARGVVAKPNFVVWPLVNDDLITVRNGEFVAESVEGHLKDALPEVLSRLKVFRTEDGWARPLMIRVPTVGAGHAVLAAMRAAGMPCVMVTGTEEDVDGPDDTADARQAAFRKCVDRTHALIQIRVVGEGVDLPIRILLDLAPTMSPVLWQQAVGRITRPTGPGEQPPLYIATNHNLTRHAYLWEGLIPSSQVRAAQQAWGPDYRPKRRTLARALGVEGFGKFTVATVPLLDGTYASLYALQTKDGLHLYSVFLHPLWAEPRFFEKTNTYTGRRLTREVPDGQGGVIEVDYAEKAYGPWRSIDGIPDATGYVSVKPGKLQPAQLSWWKKSAAHWGLDPNYEPDAREFQALPILANTRTVLPTGDEDDRDADG